MKKATQKQKTHDVVVAVVAKAQHRPMLRESTRNSHRNSTVAVSESHALCFCVCVCARHERAHACEDEKKERGFQKKAALSFFFSFGFASSPTSRFFWQLFLFFFLTHSPCVRHFGDSKTKLTFGERKRGEKETSFFQEEGGGRKPKKKRRKKGRCSFLKSSFKSLCASQKHKPKKKSLCSSCCAQKPKNKRTRRALSIFFFEWQRRRKLL